jgi:transposase-like protein
MTYESNCTVPDELREQIAEEGFDVVPEMIWTIINAAMQLERQNHLGVSPYERSPDRRDQANGYEPF